MNKAAVTYMKRELKKVLPVFILSVLYAGFIFFCVAMELANQNIEARLYFAYPDYFSFPQGGNLFGYALSMIMYQFHTLGVVLIEALLIRKVFQMENRAGVSDFLRILPVKEHHKLLMKIGAGELMLAGFSIVFGLFGTFVNWLYETELTEINSFIMNTADQPNVYAMIWQMVLVMFLALSAMFLIMFVAQCCIHNMPMAMIVGLGVLFVPFFMSGIYTTMTEKSSNMMEITGSLISHYPMMETENMVSSVGGEVSVLNGTWELFVPKIIFLLSLIVLAAVLLVLTVHFRWNIRESNNVLINSPMVAEFICTGFSICAAAAIMEVFGDVKYNRSFTIKGNVGFFVGTLFAAVIIWAVLHGIGMVMKKRKGA